MLQCTRGGVSGVMACLVVSKSFAVPPPFRRLKTRGVKKGCIPIRLSNDPRHEGQDVDGTLMEFLAVFEVMFFIARVQITLEDCLTIPYDTPTTVAVLWIAL